MTQNALVPAQSDRADQIRNRIESIRSSLLTDEIRKAVASCDECNAAKTRMEQRLKVVEEQLTQIPPIDVAVLGPSRHGKSTLLNALVGCDLLPTSDVKPCTASILKLRWAEDWAIHVTFVGKQQLKDEWAQAVRNAEEALEQQRRGDDELADDDPNYFKTTLQRFIQLFEISPDLPPDELLREVRTATIPAKTAQWLGKTAQVNAIDMAGMKHEVEKYLSTTHVYWTIVDECHIMGPFDEWHPNLSVIDLPGTNDSDPHRTEVTNSVRESATAVAIVTSDSNIGIDIESWLRNSSVLANFLEATAERRQRLFIIRTKLDSYHPNIDESLLEGLTDDEEVTLYLETLNDYKREQTKTYHAMLKDIAGPKLPPGDDEASRNKRAELLARIENINVFFVSALAHEVFSGRFSASRRTRRQLGEYFDDDIKATGIPELRSFLVRIAAEYLSDNFFEDIQQLLESEVSRMAATFQKSFTATKAEIAGGQQSLRKVVTTVESELIPWLNHEVDTRTTQFRQDALSGANGIQHRLSHVEALSERRFADKIEIWTSLHWASLRSVARKNGVHVTGRGKSIDLNEDICSVLIDDVLLAWTHFRDHLISEKISDITNGLAEELTSRLAALETGHNVPEVAEAVQCISRQLVGITYQQRMELLTAINEKIKEVESIRKPAYDIAREEMSTVLEDIGEEHGQGCSARMQDKIRRKAPAAIQQIRTRINHIVAQVVTDLATDCTGALTSFGTTAVDHIENAIGHVATSLEHRDHQVLEKRMTIMSSAVGRLPAPEAFECG